MTPDTVRELDELDDLRAAKFVPPPEEAPMAEYFLTWNGWDVFSTEDDCDSREKTKRKTSFFAVNQDTGEQRDIDISPYGYGDKHLIRRVIDLGFPKRITCAPLNHEDCDRIEAEKRAEEQARQKREADAAHRANIKRQIMAALEPMVGKQAAKNVASALMDGKIPHSKVTL